MPSKIYELTLSDAAHITGPAHTVVSATPYGAEGYGFTATYHETPPHRKLHDDVIIVHTNSTGESRTYLSNSLVKTLTGEPGYFFTEHHELTIGARTFYELTDTMLASALRRVDYPPRSQREATTRDRNYAVLTFATLI